MTHMMKNRTFDLTNTVTLVPGFTFHLHDLLQSLQSQDPLFQLESRSMQILNHDGLDEVLAETSTENKIVIIAMVNKAYVEGDKSMLDLFLDGFWLGDGTQGLVNHILIVATDPVSYKRCKFLRLHCYRLETEGVDFAEEKMYMSEDYLKMMWRRTQFLGDVLKHGYNFIFTVRLTPIYYGALRNPFSILKPNETFDFQIACDVYQGNESFKVNNGFAIVRSNNKTISLYDTWYAKRKVYVRKNEQEVLQKLMQNGLFRDLGLNVRFLDTLYFSSFSENSKDVGVVVTVHANFCRSISAKLVDLTTVIHDWKRAKKLHANETSTFKWSEHIACINSWKNLQ
ncbi:hypothetical protein RHGRI_008226 [Rhododendron griersonianum]|uniref:Nucleotide-diphospho-sugar transferase domain-containing protein n=1 Tax=Rhododendron griersonianum TaxID=479676 RepID=A0AAV6L2Q9_9ERIC|nr:hypothetical protein RHGRI_008226 [Rhododendron griersonianum]